VANRSRQRHPSRSADAIAGCNADYSGTLVLDNKVSEGRNLRVNGFEKRSVNRLGVAMNRFFFGFACMAPFMAILPLQAQVRATSADLRYCSALSELYMRYVGNPELRPSSIRRNDVTADTALAQCRAGDTASAIPVLERKLVDNRFTLPARD
jgi:hypothetical protein